MKNILILGQGDDLHARLVHDELLHRGMQVRYLNTRDFPHTIKLSDTLDPQNSFIHFTDGLRLGFSDIHSVYWRNFNGIDITEEQVPDEEQRWLASNDSRGLMESFLYDLPAKWVNGWEGYQLHQRKPAALRLAKGAGALVPKTLLSNDPVAVRNFCQDLGSVIFKPIQGGAHTLRVEMQHLTDENLQNLSVAPVTLQEEVKGTNIRAFVIGDEVIACEIQTNEVDFREDGDVKIIPHRLSQEMTQLSRGIASALFLRWSGIDYRLDHQGRYYFLEANPSPMFDGFEKLSGLPLKKMLCDYLID